MDDDRRAAVAEQRVRTVAQSYVLILKAGARLSSRVDSKVQHVAGVVAFGILESVLFVFRIEMRTCGFEVGRIAFGILMEVDGVFAGRQIVEIQLEFDAGSLLRQHDTSDRLALGIFHFNLGFGCTGQSEKDHSNSRRERGEGCEFHAGNYSDCDAEKATSAPLGHAPSTAPWSILRESFKFLSGKSAIMALDAVEQVTEQAPADSFQVLEEKIFRTIEMYKGARQAQAAAERDAQRARQQLEERDEQIVALRRETVQLRKEREEIRGRVEKMLQQIDSIAEERAS